MKLSDISMHRPNRPLTLWALITPLGRIGFGFLVDRLGPLNCYTLAWSLSGATTFALWYTMRTYAGSIAYACVLAFVSP